MRLDKPAPIKPREETRDLVHHFIDHITNRASLAVSNDFSRKNMNFFW